MDQPCQAMCPLKPSKPAYGEGQRKTENENEWSSVQTETKMTRWGEQVREKEKGYLLKQVLASFSQVYMVLA